MTTSMITVVLIVLLAMLVALVSVTVVSHGLIARRTARRVERAEQLRPLLARILADDGPSSTDPADGAIKDCALVDGASNRGVLLDDLILLWMTKVRGRDRARLQELLHQRGSLGRASRRVHSLRPSVRRRAINIMAAGGRDDAVPQITRCLVDGNRRVRNASVLGLGRLGDPAAVPFLLTAAVSRRHSVSIRSVVLALYRIGPRSGPLLIEHLTDHRPPVVRLAAQTLGHLGVTEAMDPLRTLARRVATTDEVTAGVATEALERLGWFDQIGSRIVLSEPGDSDPSPATGLAVGP